MVSQEQKAIQRIPSSMIRKLGQNIHLFIFIKKLHCPCHNDINVKQIQAVVPDRTTPFQSVRG